MTTPTRSLDSFETELLDRLRADVAGRAATPASQPVPARARLPRRRPALALAGVAATATGVLVTSLWTSTTPAYALRTEANGDLTVSIARLEDSAGLEAALAAHGIKAKVNYLPADKVCAPGRFAPTSTAVPIGVQYGLNGNELPGLRLTVNTSSWQPDWTLVVTHSGDISRIAGTVDVATGSVGACQPIDAGPAPVSEAPPPLPPEMVRPGQQPGSDSRTAAP